MTIQTGDSKFDFIHYFTRVQKTPFWHEIQNGWIATLNPSEKINTLDAANYALAQTEWDEFAKKHLVNWSRIAEQNRRWSAQELALIFAATPLSNFDTTTTLNGFTRYGKGQKEQ